MHARLLYLTVLFLLGINAFLSFQITGILPGYSGSFYWFTVPHLLLVIACCLIVYIDYKLGATWSLTLAWIFILVLPVTYWFAISRWPGGDDGPGLAWALLVGGVSLVSVLVGIPLLFLGHKLKIRRG